MSAFLFFISFLLLAGALGLGWILGASITAREIANAIRFGRLSVEQNIDRIADQIESGDYKSVRRVEGGP
jgi:hypothetical protein